MTKDEFFDAVRENAETHKVMMCHGIHCEGCPFDGHECMSEVVYFLLKACDELKEIVDGCGGN